MSKNLSSILFGVPQRAIFITFTLLMLLIWFCSPEEPTEVPEILDPTVPDEQTYTVTFNTNGGSAVPSREVNSGDTVVRPESPTKLDSIFVNWYRDADLTDVYIFSTPVTSDMTLYASWVVQTY